MPVSQQNLEHWVAVLAKSVAYLAINSGPVAHGNLGQKALALEALGMSIHEQAALLVSTPASIIEMKSRLRRERRGLGGKGGQQRGKTKK